MHSYTPDTIHHEKNPHLPIESVVVVIVITDVAAGFRSDGHVSTLPHECRRSGLNEGTMRKWRLGDDDVDENGSWSIWASNDIMIHCSTFLISSMQISWDLKRMTMIKHIQSQKHMRT